MYSRGLEHWTRQNTNATSTQSLHSSWPYVWLYKVCFLSVKFVFFLRFCPLQLAKMSLVSSVMALLSCFYLSVVSHFVWQNFLFQFQSWESRTASVVLWQTSTTRRDPVSRLCARSVINTCILHCHCHQFQHQGNQCGVGHQHLSSVSTSTWSSLSA